MKDGIEIIEFFMIKTARNDPQGWKRPMKGQGGSFGGSIYGNPFTFFTKNHQSTPRNPWFKNTLRI